MPARPGESEEDYRKRRDAEKSRPRETDEERAIRKAKEAADGKSSRPKETEEERAIRKAKEAADGKSRPRETDEERAIRKAKEAADSKSSRPKETEEERAIRKAAEAKSASRPKETDEERAIRKAKEAEEGKSSRPRETEEERAIRKAKEKEREREKEKQKVVRVETTVGSVHKPAEPPVPKPEPKVQARPAQQQDDDEDYGEDDFVDEAEAEALEKARKAMEAENEKIRKAMASKRDGPTKEKESSAAAKAAPPKQEFSGTSQISVNDLQRQKYRAQYEEDLARATALRRLVDLESVSVTIADIAPMSEYDLYIRSFGGSERAQAAVQAPPPNDIFDQEVQAERVVMRSKQSQAPEDLGLFPERQMMRGFGFGGAQQGEDDQGTTATTGSFKKSKKDKEGTSKSAATQADAPKGDSNANGESTVGTANTNNTNLGFDTAALSAFLTRVFPVVRTLMDENDSNKANTSSIKSKSEHTFSTSVTDLSTPLVEGRPVLDTQFSKASPQNVLALYGPPVQTTGPLAKYPSIALLWNVNDPTTTDKVLLSPSPLTSVCCSPSRPHLVYGGTASGSVCVWDLREPNYRHSSLPDGTATRLPSFSTEWLADNHDYPVVQVVVAGYNAILAHRSKDEAETLTSIDSRGSCCFWLVSEDTGKGGRAAVGSPSSPISSPTNDKTRKAATFSDADHGQNLFSSVKLFKASAMNLLPTGSRSDAVSCCEFFPSDPTQMVAGSSEVVHVNRYGSITAPNQYSHYARWSQNSSTSPVTSLNFSPLDSRVLLASYQDGSVRLFLKDSGEPKLTIPLATTGAISRVRCSPNLRWITFALDTTGTFYILDHASNDNKTSPSQKALISTMANGKCCSFDVSSEERVDARAAFGFDTGLLQVHTLATDVIKGNAANRNERWL